MPRLGFNQRQSLLHRSISDRALSKLEAPPSDYTAFLQVVRLAHKYGVLAVITAAESWLTAPEAARDPKQVEALEHCSS